MEGHLVFKIALIGALGVGAQWFAWRFRLPAIVLMSAAGIFAGPVLGLLHPAEDFGEMLRPIIAVAVSVILFEGGLNLNFRELHGTGKPVTRLILIGVPLGWLLGSLAAYYVAGLSLPVAVLFAGILVVTGPTVIMPLLRQANLSSRPAAILKWEGIINDPVGALLAVFVLEYITVSAGEPELLKTSLLLTAKALAGGAVGYAGGRFLAFAFTRGLVPEFLKAPTILCCVLVFYEAGNMIQEETGLVSVTVLGMTLANSRIASIEEIRRFKEYITIVLTSGLFVILTATLEPSVIKAINLKFVFFILAVLFIVRPLTVFIAMLGTELSWKERLFIAWIAPRGVVAVAISGFFAIVLVEHGYPDGMMLIPLSFGIVFATVAAHGFSISWLARRLGLTATERPGVLIAGGSPWTTQLANVLQQMKIPVVLCDTSWQRLKDARLLGVPIAYTEILSEHAEYTLQLNRFGYILAAANNDAYNALICSQFAPEYGRDRVFQLSTEEAGNAPKSLSYTLQGRILFGDGMGYDELIRLCFEGWRISKTRLTKEYDLGRYLASRPDAKLILVMSPDGNLRFNSAEHPPEVEEGDTIVTFCPPEPETVTKNGGEK